MANLKFKSGDDETLRFTITDADSAAVNLTGGTIKFKIATSIGTSDANAEYLGSYTSFTDASNGIHDETIPDSTTNSWTVGEYRYQARFIDSAGLVVSEDVGYCKIQSNLIDDE